MGSRNLWYSCEYFEKWEEDIKSKSFSQEPHQKITQCKKIHTEVYQFYLCWQEVLAVSPAFSGLFWFMMTLSLTHG